MLVASESRSMAEQDDHERRDRPLERSAALLDRARRVIPGAAQTNSKSPSQFVQGVAPSHLVGGEDGHVFDADGNEYVDFVSGLGPIVLGHGYPAVTEAVTERVREGTALSLPHTLQVEVAERVVETVPCAEMVRFGKNGHDVIDAATKLMRAATGDEIVASQGYHGWTDPWMFDSSLDRGIPDVDYRIRGFDYGDAASLEAVFEAHGDDVAGVVTTPVNTDPPAGDFLERVRELCDEHGALLAFDEVLTGFRLAPGGAGEYFGVDPDLACFAKAMANGYPISALAGRRAVMEVMEADDFYFSMTYAGETASLAAARATIDVLDDEPVHDRLFEIGRRLRDGYGEIAADHGLDDVTHAHGLAPMFRVSFDDHGPTGTDERYLESLFMQECFDRGVLFSGTHLPAYTHTDADVAHALDAYDAAMAELSDALAADAVEERLRGPPVGETVRERTGEDG
jgi:glutamate-1-semialdehyde aminotransferase